MSKKLLLLVIPLMLIFISISAITNASPQKATVFNQLNGHRKVVNVGDPHAFDGGYLLEIARSQKYDETMLGYSVVSAYRTTLSSPMTSTQTTVPVSSLVTKDGHTLTMTDLGSKVFLTIEAGSSKEEIVMCTTISGSAWATCTRGLAFYGTSVTAVAANQKTHSAGSSVTISNVHYVYEQYNNIEDAQTIAGLKTFTTIPQIPTTTPTLDAQAASKKYVDDVTNAGAADGTETVKGIWEGATQDEMSIGTNLGGTGAGLLLQNRYATSTPSATTTIPITDANGKLSQSFINLVSPWVFQGAVGVGGQLSAVGNFKVYGTSEFQGAITSTSTATSTFAGNLFGGGFYHTTVATTTGAGTWSVPTGVKKVKISLVGGGGNGGNESSGNSTGGGGSGAYAMKLVDVSSTSTIGYTVGLAASTTLASISGVTILQATGGSNVSIDTANGGSGGTATLGDININGQTGNAAIPNVATNTMCGSGANSMFGFGGASIYGNNSNGNSGTGYGSGGSGCISLSSTCTGGAGATGVVIIEW